MNWRAAAIGIALASLAIAGCGGSSSPVVAATRPPLDHQAAEPKAQRQASRERSAESKDEKKRLKRARSRRERKRKARFAEESRATKQRRAQHSREQKKKEEAAATSRVAPITAEEFHSFTGVDLSNWEIAYGACAVTPENQLAKEFHTEQNFGAIGYAYGSGYREPFNIAPEEGCMAALLDSHAEREAAFKLMEENE